MHLYEQLLQAGCDGRLNRMLPRQQQQAKQGVCPCSGMGAGWGVVLDIN